MNAADSAAMSQVTWARLVSTSTDIKTIQHGELWLLLDPSSFHATY